MLPIKGKFTDALIMCNEELEVGPIGLTMTIGERILPSLVGIDIGCGMLAVKVGKIRSDFQKLDTVIRDNVPVGFKIREKAHRQASEFDFERLRCCKHIRSDKALLSIGTLGGGNHFIEIDRASDGTQYLVIQSGSRNLGKQVAEIYQALAVDLDKGIGEYLEYKEAMKGIYTSSVCEATIDEAPMAYKSLEDIIDVIKESVEIIDVMKPIYNFKAP